MVIDARGIPLEATLHDLRETFRAEMCAELKIEVIFLVGDDARRAGTFARMSGFQAEITKNEDIWRLIITGTSCGCV